MIRNAQRKPRCDTDLKAVPISYCDTETSVHKKSENPGLVVFVTGIGSNDKYVFRLGIGIIDLYAAQIEPERSSYRQCLLKSYPASGAIEKVLVLVSPDLSCQ